MTELKDYAPIFALEEWTDEEQWLLTPFFTNLDRSVYVPNIPFPELIGALTSRTSRAVGDLRQVFLRDFILPFLDTERGEDEDDDAYRDRVAYGGGLKEFVGFLHKHSFQELFANPKARAFYLKWLAAYGDDSIAQMAGTHLAFWGISQPAIKHLEDQRIGLAPLEQSTRYVDYSGKVNGHYRYYTDPTLARMGLIEPYRRAMDGLFDTYAELVRELGVWLGERFPDEGRRVIGAKAFDTVRGLLPAATLSQVAFFGNGQAFEYLVSRCLRHPLGEIRWIGQRSYEELAQITPSFLRRVTSDVAAEYQEYLGERRARMAPAARELFGDELVESAPDVSVELVEYEPKGENMAITGMLYDVSGMHRPWSEIYRRVENMSDDEKRKVIAKYLEGRTARWQKVGRAFENLPPMRFEIVMDIGAFRDLHRHRMHTQQRQLFSCHHGYAVPQEVIEAGLEGKYRGAVERTEDVFAAIERHDPELAQYAVPMAHRVRFHQFQNARAFFWEAELRSIPEGHPNYRIIEQLKFERFRRAYPLLGEHVHVNMGDYDFARRGQEERIRTKEKKLSGEEI